MITPKQARYYIDNFKNFIIPGTEFVDFPSGRIEFDDMTDDEAIKVAEGLMELEAEAIRGKISQ